MSVRPRVVGPRRARGEHAPAPDVAAQQRGRGVTVRLRCYFCKYRLYMVRSVNTIRKLTVSAKNSLHVLWLNVFMETPVCQK